MKARTQDEHEAINEIEAAWSAEGQGHREAMERGKFCVVAHCDKDAALRIARWFVRHIFAIPTCTHYDGKTLSLYCGSAGQDDVRRLMREVESYVLGLPVVAE